MEIRIENEHGTRDCWIDLELAGRATIKAKIAEVLNGEKGNVYIVELAGQPDAIPYDEEMTLEQAVRLQRIITHLETWGALDGAGIISSYLEVFPYQSWRELTPEKVSSAYMGLYGDAEEFGEQYADSLGILESLPANLHQFFNFKAFGESLLSSRDFYMCNFGRVFRVS